MWWCLLPVVADTFPLRMDLVDQPGRRREGLLGSASRGASSIANPGDPEMPGCGGQPASISTVTRWGGHEGHPTKHRSSHDQLPRSSGARLGADVIGADGGGAVLPGVAGRAEATDRADELVIAAQAAAPFQGFGGALVQWRAGPFAAGQIGARAVRAAEAALALGTVGIGAALGWTDAGPSLAGLPRIAADAVALRALDQPFGADAVAGVAHRSLATGLARFPTPPAEVLAVALSADAPIAAAVAVLR